MCVCGGGGGGGKLLGPTHPHHPQRSTAHPPHRWSPPHTHHTHHWSPPFLQLPGNRALELEAQGYTVLFAFEEAIGYMFGQAGVAAAAIRAAPRRLAHPAA